MSNPRPSVLDGDAIRDPLAWLMPFRWAVAGIEVVGILAAGPFGGLAIARWIWAVPLLQAATNLTAWMLARPGVDRSLLTGLLLVLDAGFLTALFAASGGSASPFTTFYLVLIVFSALVLRPFWSWATAIASIAGFSLLFVLPSGEAAHAFSWHLRGMWAAFVAAAVATALFVTLLRQARDRRERDLERLRDLAGRYERLAVLSTCAAGAAHELATPLGTVALASERIASGRLDREGVTREADGIGEEIARCRVLLDELAGRAGEATGEAPRSIEPAALVERALDRLAGSERGRVTTRFADSLPSIVVPERGLDRSLLALLRNAIEASAAGTPIEAEVTCDGDRVVFRVADRGAGIEPDLAGRIGEPFLSTKGKEGLGLGLFAASRLAELLGGGLTLAPRAGGGTVAELVLPTKLRKSGPR